MKTSVAIQAYLAKIKELFTGQGFDPNMRVIYAADDATATDWLTDELANQKMQRKGITNKDNVRNYPFMALFWTRSPLSPIVRQRYRLLDTPKDGEIGPGGRSTVSAKFTIAMTFVSNKANTVEDLEEAFSTVFANTYNAPISLQYIWNDPKVKGYPTNITFIQNAGSSDLVNYKEGNLFAYTWSATIYMNHISEFAWDRVHPLDEIVVDLYGPNGIPLSSLDINGRVRTGDYTAADGTVVENVPEEPTVAYTVASPHEYIYFSISAVYEEDRTYISDETRAIIDALIIELGGNASLRRAPYIVVARMPISKYGTVEYTRATLIEGLKKVTGTDWVVTPMDATK